MVAIRLIGNINDHGYLRVLDDMGEPMDGDEIIATVAYELDNDEAYVEEVLEMCGRNSILPASARGSERGLLNSRDGRAGRDR